MNKRSEMNLFLMFSLNEKWWLCLTPEIFPDVSIFLPHQGIVTWIGSHLCVRLGHILGNFFVQISHCDIIKC